MRKEKKIIDISSEEKKREVFEIFNSLTSRNKAHECFGISDNKQGSNYLKEIANEVGFDFSIYDERRKKTIRYCEECGKELVKWQKKFCCSACAAKYNNKHRDKSVYEKLANTLRKKNVTVLTKLKIDDNDRVCIVCGQKINSRNFKYCSDECKKHEYDRKNKGNCTSKNFIEKTCECCGKKFSTKNMKARFCSNECSSIKSHEESYEDFLRNNEKYCRGNYTPKSFKNEFLKEQGGVCAICGCSPEHNGKPLIFVLDHIDGDASNNTRENLRMVCPNCDSQLDTFKSKNKHSTRRNYWKENLLKQIQS